MKYIVLAQQYYEWQAQRQRESKRFDPAIDAETSAHADARWMSELFQIVGTSARSDVVRVQGCNTGKERKLPLNCLMEYPE